ncbi:hypothetical protein BaRGS_00014663 [Batillaria attramentaria]|uniref:Glyoxylate reductase/hydroxypyruvate reductase n=1 Tax=Batillaria attramentaria TaxID=370345 RepID=A0ABD0L4C4_9CAEN
MAKPVVYVTRKIPDAGLKILRQRLTVKHWDSEDAIPRDELLKNVAGVDGILCTISDKIDKELLEAAGSNLKAISTMSVGETHIDKQECDRRLVHVANAPEVASDSAAEFTVALVLLTARRLLEGMEAVVSGEWGPWRPMWIVGFEMVDRTLGIFGFGRVGFGVARRLRPFNVGKIIYHDLFRAGYADQVDAKLVTFDTLLNESDILCICCNVTAQTVHAFDKEAFSKMKAGSILVNTARGTVINQDDLAEALDAGIPHAAALDVTEPEPLPLDHPLMVHPRCIISPHMGTATMDTRINMAVAAAKNLDVMLLGMPDSGENWL